ncbi:MAG: YaaL family protein [Acetivibrio sp.]
MPKKKKSLLQIKEEIIQNELFQTKIAMDSAYSNFDNALDPDLIDCSIYELNAAQQRYKVLLQQAKQMYLHK